MRAFVCTHVQLRKQKIPPFSINLFTYLLTHERNFENYISEGWMDTKLLARVNFFPGEKEALPRNLDRQRLLPAAAEARQARLWSRSAPSCSANFLVFAAVSQSGEEEVGRIMAGLMPLICQPLLRSSRRSTPRLAAGEWGAKKRESLREFSEKEKVEEEEEEDLKLENFDFPRGNFFDGGNVALILQLCSILLLLLRPFYRIKQRRGEKEKER